MSEPKLGKEKLYMVSFNDTSIKPVPIVAENTEKAKEMIAKEGKYRVEDIKEITFKESYYAWDYKLAGIYGPTDQDWDLD